jgi:hypothetical protein
MRAKLRSTFAAALFVLGVTAGADAQCLGTIRGIVHDPSGRPTPGAVVTISHPMTKAVRVALTDLHGEYVVTGLLPDTPYIVQISHPRFKRQTVETRAYASTTGMSKVQLTEKRATLRH